LLLEFGNSKIIYRNCICISYHANIFELAHLNVWLDDSGTNKHLLNFIQAEGRNVDELICLVIQFVEVMKDVIKMFAVFIHATLSNGSPVHTSIMGTSTWWKIAECDVINLMVRFNTRRKCNNSTKSRVRKDVYPKILAVTFLALSHSLRWFSVGEILSTCISQKWVHNTSSNILDEVNI
jgi:hypothetical protein